MSLRGSRPALRETGAVAISSFFGSAAPTIASGAEPPNVISTEVSRPQAEKQISSFRAMRIRSDGKSRDSWTSPFGPKSDIDVLVGFKPDARVGFFELYDMEQELLHLLRGRKVDINTPNSLTKYSRDKVMREAEEQYVRTSCEDNL